MKPTYKFISYETDFKTDSISDYIAHRTAHGFIFQCLICHTETFNRVSFYNHHRTKSHKNKSNKDYEKFNSCKYKCNTCFETKKHHSSFLSHFNSKAHKNVVEKVGLHKDDNYCHICETPFYTKKTLASHMRGERHKKKVMNSQIVNYREPLNTHRIISPPFIITF